MATYTSKTLFKLIDKIADMPKKADSAMANTLNRASTFSIKESINEITRENNLSVAYLNSKFGKVARASSRNLRTIIKADDRRTLLSRYPHSKSGKDVKVSVKRGKTTTLKRAFTVSNLKGSSASGIAMLNRDYFRYLKTNKPLKSTKRGGKISKALQRSINNPRGWHVLHGASVNQMFEDVRVEIKPATHRFMAKEFFKQFSRIVK